MKYLGVDYGSKRIGIALSDSQGTVAAAYGIFDNDKTFFPLLKDTLLKECIEVIIVGESNNLDGNPNRIQKQIDDFVEKCKQECGVAVFVHTEVFSSMQVKWGAVKPVRRSTKKDRISKKITSPEYIDAAAATVMLQSYLDKQGRVGSGIL